MLFFPTVYYAYRLGFLYYTSRVLVGCVFAFWNFGFGLLSPIQVNFQLLESDYLALIYDYCFLK